MFAAAVILAGCSGSQYAQESRTKYRDDANRTGTKANAISRRSIDVLPQERAYLILPDDNIRVDGVSGNIVMLPPGDHSFNFYRLKGTTGGSVSVPVGGGFSVGVSTPGTRTGNIEDAVTGTGTVEAGKYYMADSDVALIGGKIKSVAIVEMTGKKLEQAKERIAEWLSMMDGAVIGGLTWAGTNIGMAGYFVGTPDDFGNYYTFDEAQTACPEGWRLPTREEFEKLIEAGHETTNIADVPGMTFGSGDNRVFFPCGGAVTANGVTNISYGYYWSSTPKKNTAYGLSFNIFNFAYNNAGLKMTRTNGMSVRCVQEEPAQ